MVPRGVPQPWMHPLLFSKFLDSIVYPICQSIREPLSKTKPIFQTKSPCMNFQISYFTTLLCLPLLARPKTTLKSVPSFLASLSLLFFHTLFHVCSFLPSSIIGPCYLLFSSSTIVDFKLSSKAPPLLLNDSTIFLGYFSCFLQAQKNTKELKRNLFRNSRSWVALWWSFLTLITINIITHYLSKI
jgi:hypothetical protein